MSILNPGQIIEERYRVLNVIGEGGMNRVYLVGDVRTGKKWAMKVTKEPGELNSSQQEAYNQFLKEISILTTIRHPGLTTVEDYFSHENQYFIIEDYLDGCNLEEYMRDNPVQEKEVAQWSLAICDVLEVLHAHDIVFRDLKPANIMLLHNKSVKLIDFDIARRYKKESTIDTNLLGTPGYAAPETYGKSQSDARSDIFSLGATMHHLITGENPQDKPFQFEPVEKLRRGVNRRFAALIGKALNMEPEERFGKISDIKHELALVLTELEKSSPLQVAGASAHLLTPHRGAGLEGTIAETLAALGPWGHKILDTIGMPTPDRVLLKRCTSRPPGITIQQPAQWGSPTGDNMTPCDDTYVFYPRYVTRPVIVLKEIRVNRNRPLEAIFQFSVVFTPGIGHYNPWPAELRILIGMPVNVNYVEGRGVFAPLPGVFEEYSVETPNCWSGDQSCTIIEVVHDNSCVRGKIRWRPDPALPEMKYDAWLPWHGPMLILEVSQPRAGYRWFYTKGFVIV